MNARFLLSTAVFLVAASSAARAGSVAMRDAATHDQLALAMQQSQQADPMKSLPVSKIEDPSVNLPKDLVSQSDFICVAGVATLVPKHAILKVPADYANRIRFQEGSRILGWADFFNANRNWITTVEITPEQAEGKVPLSDETASLISKSTNLIVATFKGGPISLLPPKPATETASTKP
jgi:hypothetical protein